MRALKVRTGVLAIQEQCPRCEGTGRSPVGIRIGKTNVGPIPCGCDNGLMWRITNVPGVATEDALKVLKNETKDLFGLDRNGRAKELRQRIRAAIRPKESGSPPPL